MTATAWGVDPAQGLVSTDIFTDPALYARELDRIFRRTWLYVGHDTQIPEPGDYLTNYLAENEVIVIRGRDRQVRVLRNQCAHRGNKVCLFDRGNAPAFSCTFHGWRYDDQGQLVGVPFLAEGYHGEVDFAGWGLQRAPRVESYGGFIFASWDRDIVGLDSYLGDLRWYLDRLLVQEFLGGVEVVGGRQRYTMPTNWKLLAENFQGDDYHVQITHASYLRVLAEESQGLRGTVNLNDRLQVAVGYPDRIAHGLGALKVGTEPKDITRELQIAEQLGPEAVEWIRERDRRVRRFQRDDPVKLHLCSNINVFPNFSVVSGPNAIFGTGLLQWHPRGPMVTEVWQWALVDRQAPEVVKRTALRELVGAQAAAGMLAPDDSENFERSSDNLAARWPSERPFHYAMAIDRDDDPGLRDRLAAEGVDVDQLPGLIGPYVWEVNQRQFYRYWAELLN